MKLQEILIADIRERAELCLSDKRPKANYSGFFRESREKVRNHLDSSLEEIWKYYSEHPKCTPGTQKQFSQDLLEIINGRNN